nr:hypothetical protein [Tanacetum cinerariifolium]
TLDITIDQQVVLDEALVPHASRLRIGKKHKDTKKSNEIYYPRFTKVIVNFFMTKDQSIPRRNKVNWHYARDDHMFTTIKLVFRHQNTQQYDVILLVKLTNEAIRNFESYKKYYAIALGAEPPKTKAIFRKKQSSSNTTVPPPTKGKRIKTSAKVDKPAKEKQHAKSSTAKGLNVLSEVALNKTKAIFKKKQSSSNTTVPPPTKGKRIKTSAKVDKPAKEKQHAKSSTAKGLNVLSEVALNKVEHIKLATKRSLTQTHIYYAIGSSEDEGTVIIPGVFNVPN